MIKKWQWEKLANLVFFFSRDSHLPASTGVTFSFEHPTTRGSKHDLKCHEKGIFHWRLNYCDFMCLTFLHCVFSIGGCKYHERGRFHWSLNYSACMCLTFFHCVFSIGGCEMPGKGRFHWSLFYIDCILHWLHLFNFFSTVCFQMSPQIKSNTRKREDSTEVCRETSQSVDKERKMDENPWKTWNRNMKLSYHETRQIV